MTSNQENNRSIETDTKLTETQRHRTWQKSHCKYAQYVQEGRERHESIEEKNARFVKPQVELLKMKNTVSQMKNTLDGINSRLNG